MILLLAIPIINAGLESYHVFTRLHYRLLNEDSISHAEVLFGPVRQKLQDLKVLRLSYRVDPGAYWEERVGDYVVVQYVLAPIILRPHNDEDAWVLMNYSAVGKRFPAPDLVCIEDFGSGLALYRKGQESRVFDPGESWRQIEGMWVGTWKRRGSTQTFDATWRAPDGAEIQDEVTLESVTCHDVVLFRKGTRGRYRGRLSIDGTKIEAGSADWFQPQDTWSATISR